MTTCRFCKKTYEGYIVILSADIECFLMEDHIKKIYYNDEKNIGVCEECRKSEIVNNPVSMIRAWLSVKCQLILAKDDAKEKGNIKQVKKYEEALKQIEKYEQKLEETKEVKELYLRNNPASFKSIPEKTKLCYYCDENKGQKWINNPTETPKLDNCWWICIPCEKIMEKQMRYSYLSHFQNMIKEQNLPKLEKNIKEKADKLLKEIKDIAYEDGHEVCSFEIKKTKNGYKSKQVY